MTTHADAPFWDRMARRYSRHAIKDMAGYERTLDRIRGLLPSHAAVLEVGCGTGTSALRLAPSVGRMVATDVSPEMIAIAREKAATEGVTKVSFEVAPAETPPATAGGFDAVLALNVLHLLDNRPALLRRMAERLKPGGLLVSKTPCLGEMTPALRLLVPAMRLVGFAPRHVAFATEADLVAEMGDAGLTVIARERHGSGKRDPRVFIVARKGVDDAPHASGLLE